MTDEAVAQLTILANPAALELVHNLLASLWSDCDDVADEDRIQFEIAVIEIANNITTHADTERFSIRINVAPGHLEALFHDSGKAFSIDPAAHQLPDDLAESGRGLALARATVDELHYDRDGPYNRWRILRQRRPS